MTKLWKDEAWADYLQWQTQDKKTLKRINKLIQDIECNVELYLDHAYIKAELERSMQEADNPGTPRFTHKEMMAGLKQQREARNHAV